jgi:hypothetical protein
MAVEEIYDKSPDIVRLEGVSESSAQKISNNFVDTYSLISVSENIYHMVLTEKYVFEISNHPSSEDEIGIVEYFNTDGKALLSFVELKSDNISDNAKSILGDIFSGSSKEMIIAFSNMDRVTAESLYGNAVSVYEMLGENPVSDDHIPYFFGYGFCIGEYNASYVLSFFCSETSVNIYS